MHSCDYDTLVIFNSQILLKAGHTDMEKWDDFKSGQIQDFLFVTRDNKNNDTLKS
jgi:hypothetical protein